jgi:hypothetical protein
MFGDWEYDKNGLNLCDLAQSMWKPTPIGRGKSPLRLALTEPAVIALAAALLIDH